MSAPPPRGPRPAPHLVFVLVPVLAAALLAACGDGADPRPDPDRCVGYAEAPAYVLPYPVGRAYAVLRANCSAPGTTHEAGGAFAYAYDFDLAIGDPVVAARAGAVVGTEDRFADGNRLAGAENYVHVRHDDGTIGRYYHLTQGGVRVPLGARVAPGDTIGESGDTGNSSRPHLHFDVARCREVGCETLPVTFRNTDPHPTGLQAGRTYTARP